MSENPENPPAFPSKRYHHYGRSDDTGQTEIMTVPKDDAPGMTLRDYFAAKAMQGMLASAEREFAINGQAAGIDKVAYWIADAMLKERVK